MPTPQLFIAFSAEGPTDYRFLETIMNRTIEDIVYSDCTTSIDIESIIILPTKKLGLSFDEYVLKAAEDAIIHGAQLLIVHSDSDKDTYDERIAHKFTPARNAMLQSNNQDIVDYEPYLIPIIPIRMIEAWMLADKELLKEEIGTNLPDAQLGLTGEPEQIAHPKDSINRAIQIAKENSKRKRKVMVDDISQLYDIMGSRLSIDRLERLTSYQKFTDELKRGFRALGYLH